MEYHKALKVFGEKLQKKATRAVRDLAIQVHESLVDRTPIDTGRAKASWRMKVGPSPRLDVANEQDKIGAVAAKTQSKVSQRTLLGYRDAFRQIIWISNNLEYIRDLEHGSSKQAPLGMVTLTLAQLVQLGYK